jgi:hypothetical protein
MNINKHLLKSKNNNNINARKNLKKATKLLVRFRKFQHRFLNQSKSLLQNFDDNKLKISFYEEKEKNFIKSQRIIETFRQKRLYRFNIFNKIGFHVDENRFSDAIADLLNPRGNHQLGLTPLKCLLEQISNQTPDVEASVNLIYGTLDRNKKYISVHRERWEGKTIPDIEIICSDFIIFIENKIRKGKETLINNAYQTDRQWDILQKRCAQLNIPENQLLAIFLTPEGKCPENPHFISLPVRDLISSFRRAIKLSRQCCGRHSIEAFLDFYYWE